MNNSRLLINQLFSIRNQYGKNASAQKLKLLNAIGNKLPGSAKPLHLYYEVLLFFIAYPGNKAIYQLANEKLEQLQSYIQANETLKSRLYNTGITQTELSAAFGFEIVKWLRTVRPKDIRFNSFIASDSQVNSTLSVVMPKVESEILQDANATWRSWLKQSMKKGEDLLDRLIAVFDETALRPEARDELWNALGLNVEISFPVHDCLPRSLYTPYYHRSLIKKKFKQELARPARVALTQQEAAAIIDCGRIILVRHLREMDPISFTAPDLVAYYQLERGFSVALTGMVPGRRHPIDSYMGYIIFKNGLPFGYAGSWILFDSARIGLNVFPAYRGGESQYIFDQVLKLHAQVYKLSRFSVDPYQVGKENSDGIHSGVFWLYHHIGFRPIKEEQKQLAQAEALKMRSEEKYRSPVPVLKELADSRLELVLKKRAVGFDATDLSIAYATILEERFNGNRKQAESSFIILAELLKIKNYHEAEMQFILKNWCVLILYCEAELARNRDLRRKLKKLFELKASGSEEAYISGLQQAKDLRKLLESVIKMG